MSAIVKNTGGSILYEGAKQPRAFFFYISHTCQFDLAVLMAVRDASTQPGCGSRADGSRGANDVR